MSIHKQYCFIMGDTLSIEKEQTFLEKIDYFQPADDPNYGKLQIYRMKEPPYEYVLDHRKTFIEDQDRLQAYLRQSSKLKQVQHKNLAKIHAVIMKEDKQLCIIHRVVHTYCSFYNFTLAQAIAKKKFTRNTFPEGDLVYLMHSLVDGLCALKRHELAFGQFRTESIYLSPQGHVKLYLIDLDPDSKHSAFYRVLGQHGKMSEYLLAPQQLAAVRKMQYQMRFSIWKAELFSVGMVMLELITLDSARFYYNQQRMDVMLSKALFSLDVHQAKYSAELLQIIKECLQGEPQMRPEPEYLLRKLEEMRGGGRSTVYCIRLQAEQNKEKKEEGVVRPKGQFILNSLAKKLNPSPISTISSSSASLYRTGEVKSSSLKGKSDQLFRE